MRFVREPTNEEKTELRRMTRQEVGRVAMRAHIVLLSARGYTVQQIEEVHNTSQVTVYKWFDRFEEQGPQGLYDEPRSGRPPKVDETVKETLAEVLSDSPSSQGYNFTVWTVALLSEYVKEKLKVRVCNDTLRRTLHELGFRWRRPRWAVEREDPQAAALMAAITQAVWKADAQTMTWVEDETKFRALPPLRNMWMGAVF
jgi:transposase